MYFLIGVIVLALIQPQMWQSREQLNYPEAFYTGIYDGTTDTGESSPRWSTRFMEKRFKKPLELIGGAATATQVLRKSTHHKYNVTVTKDAQFVENTVYFPGWNVFIDGQPTQIEYQNVMHRGLMTFYVPYGTHSIDIQFTDTKMRGVSNSISVLGIVMLLAIPYLFYRKSLVSYKGKK